MIDAATKAGVATIVIDLNLRISQGDAAEADGTVLSGVGVRCLADCEHVESGDFESSLGLSKIQARSLCKRMIKLAESSGGQIPSAVLSTLQDEERTTPERNAEPPAADCLEVSVEKEVAEEDTMMGAAGSDAYSSDSDEEFIPDDSHDASGETSKEECSKEVRRSAPTLPDIGQFASALLLASGAGSPAFHPKQSSIKL
eukprot:IDg42t1